MEKNTLPVYCLAGPLLSTEWLSIMGDKYRAHVDFEPVLVGTPEEAKVIVWDGVVSPKSAPIIADIMEKLSDKAVFLITGEAQTFLKGHPFVQFTQRDFEAVYLPPSRELPEEILVALEECRKRGQSV